VGVINHTDADQDMTLDFTGDKVAAKDPPRTIHVGARSRGRIRIEAEGVERGRGSLSVRVSSGQGQAQFSLPIEIIGTELRKEDLGRVESLALLCDVWGRVEGSKKKTVWMNGVEAGDLAGGHGYPSWTTRVRTMLGNDARAALKAANEVRIENPEKDNIKVRNVVLEVKLDGGATVHLRSDPRVRSTLPSWMHAEGIVVEAGAPMIWQVPAIAAEE